MSLMGRIDCPRARVDLVAERGMIHVTMAARITSIASRIAGQVQFGADQSALARQAVDEWLRVIGGASSGRGPSASSMLGDSPTAKTALELERTATTIGVLRGKAAGPAAEATIGAHFGIPSVRRSAITLPKDPRDVRYLSAVWMLTGALGVRFDAEHWQRTRLPQARYRGIDQVLFEPQLWADCTALHDVVAVHVALADLGLEMLLHGMSGAEVRATTAVLLASPLVGYLDRVPFLREQFFDRFGDRSPDERKMLLQWLLELQCIVPDETYECFEEISMQARVLLQIGGAMPQVIALLQTIYVVNPHRDGWRYDDRFAPVLNGMLRAALEKGIEFAKMDRRARVLWQTMLKDYGGGLPVDERVRNAIDAKHLKSANGSAIVFFSGLDREASEFGYQMIMTDPPE